MPNENKNKVKELRLRFVPLSLHEKIEKYMSQVHSKQDRVLTKETGCIELLEKATKHIKLPA